VLWFDHNVLLNPKRLHRAHFRLSDASETHRPLGHIGARALGVIDLHGPSMRKNKGLTPSS
jgi:hypothetical protein